VDAYGEDEQATGLLTMMQEHIACPVSALVVGEPVQVIGFDFSDRDSTIVALCKRHGKQYRIGVTSLDWEGKPPHGSELIEAYKARLKGDW
jgi:hypothetical protein